MPEPTTPEPTDAADHLRRIQTVRHELDQLEKLLGAGHDPSSPAVVNGSAQVLGHARRLTAPAWLRVTPGESRWVVTVIGAVAIALQLVLPERFALAYWLLPALEACLLAALVVANPGRMNRESRSLRAISLTLTGLITLANGRSAVVLSTELVTGRVGDVAGPLLRNGGTIWLTNVIAFGLLYWQFDRGGPAARAHARRTLPDFLFPQMQAQDLTRQDWEPSLLDYLYLSFTNATAFSPTDVLPLSRWAKMLMLVQSAISLAVVALVIARAVNVLK